MLGHFKSTHGHDFAGEEGERGEQCPLKDSGQTAEQQEGYFRFVDGQYPAQWRPLRRLLSLNVVCLVVRRLRLLLVLPLLFLRAEIMTPRVFCPRPMSEIKRLTIYLGIMQLNISFYS